MDDTNKLSEAFDRQQAIAAYQSGDFNGDLPGFIAGYLAAKADSPPVALPAVVDAEAFRIALHEWAVAGWRSEVQNRPLVNVHRQQLDDFWRHAIRKAGGNPDAIVGPSHEDLLATHPAPASASEPEGWRAALKFYADGCHFTASDETAWDTVSGEPQNFWCDEAGTATIEDGTVAKMALGGTPLPDEKDGASASVAGASEELPSLDDSRQRLRNSIAWLRDGKSVSKGIGVADMVVIEAALAKPAGQGDGDRFLCTSCGHGWNCIDETEGPRDECPNCGDCAMFDTQNPRDLSSTKRFLAGQGDGEAGVPADPELTSSEVNDACWAWVNAMAGKAAYDSTVWNNLKPAIHAAICRFLAELRDPAYPPAPQTAVHADGERDAARYRWMMEHCGFEPAGRVTTLRFVFDPTIQFFYELEPAIDAARQPSTDAEGGAISARAPKG